MKIELATFKNTVAKKIFLLFILAAFLPVCVFAFLSTRQIDKVTGENAQIQLQKNSKAYSYALSDRLSSRDAAMVQIASLIVSDPSTVDWPEKKKHLKWFDGLFLFSKQHLDKAYWSNLANNTAISTSLVSTLSAKEIQFLDSTKTLIKVIYSSPAQTARKSQIFMIKRVKHSSLLVAVINTKELLGYEDDFDQRTGFCIFSGAKQILFCSESEVKTSLITMSNKVDLSSRGSLSWADDINSIYAGYNSLFLEYHYFQQDWMIIFAQLKTESAFFKKDFNQLFYSIIAITLIFVVYISFLSIRKQMKPLDALMQGISRIRSNNFSLPVPVKGKDEFAELAYAFNDMSEQVSDQFKVLEALAEIDQLILSRLSIQDVIKMVINRANKFIDSDSVSITLLDSEALSKGNTSTTVLATETINATLYRADPHIDKVILEEKYHIPNLLVEFLAEKPMIEFLVTKKNLNAYIEPIIDSNFKFFVIIPIRQQANITAFLSFSYYKPVILSETIKTWGQEFSDRIAVAFANASWEKELYHQAHYDSLTGLPNRLMFNDQLQYTLDQAQRDESMPVLLFMDLDGFKYVNDSLGHLVGDKLLKVVATRINECVRKTDTVARLGGDEFVVILSGYHQMTSFTLIKTVKKILSSVSLPIELGENTLRITSSIGIAIYPQDGESIENLLKNADVAMYEAKKQGRAQYQFYSKELNASMLNKLLLDTDLHNVLDKNQLELYYQAKVDTNTGEIIGAEALMRWIYPDKGIIAPGVFIPLIEQSGLIIPIGNWLVHEACRQNKEWQDKGLKKIIVSINLSAQQFKHKELLSDINDALTYVNLEPQYLELEITESMAMDNFESSVDIVSNIKALGVSFSIDDYGTGYSSLEYIKDIPVNLLKIDRAFIINLVSSYKEQAIVKSTITMAHDLGLKVIAEGVETKEQCLMLKQMDCDEIQGFFYSKPIPAKEFEKLLAQKVLKVK